MSAFALNAKRCTLLLTYGSHTLCATPKIREATQLRASIRIKNASFNEAGDR